MGEKERWIDEQKKNRMFEHGESSHDAERMLQHAPVNRNLSVRQGAVFTTARVLGQSLIGDKNFLADLADEFERVQLNIDKDSRKDFKEIAIEQFRGKLQAAKNKISEALL